MDNNTVLNITKEKFRGEEIVISVSFKTKYLLKLILKYEEILIYYQNDAQKLSLEHI